MYGSPAMSKDLNLPFPALPFKQGNEMVVLQQGRQQQMVPSGLLRHRTAPSNVIGDECDEGVGAESMFARFMSPDLRDHVGGGKRSSGSPSEGVPSSPSQTTGFPSSGPPHMFFHAPLHQQPRQQRNPNLSSAASGGVDGGGGSNVVGHGSTSPPGLFCHLNAENARFAGLRTMGGFRSPGGNGDNTEVGTSCSRLKGQISFNSQQGSLMSQVSDIGSDALGGSSSEEGSGGVDCSGRGYIPGYPVASWEDSVLLSDSFSGRGKRIRLPSEVQNGDSRNHEPTLTHHFGSPKASAEATAMERFLQFQEAVPCKIRAKRGCATHPRSIAERVRRTRISEKMRKLQELVPNMEKQTNTADMLDLAVDYIKDLQRQAKVVFNLTPLINLCISFISFVDAFLVVCIIPLICHHWVVIPFIQQLSNYVLDHNPLKRKDLVSACMADAHGKPGKVHLFRQAGSSVGMRTGTGVERAFGETSSPPVKVGTSGVVFTLFVDNLK